MTCVYQLTLLLALLVMAGCNGPDQTTIKSTSETARATQELQDKYRDAATATRNYVAENKDEFLASMDKKLKELDQKILALTNKSGTYKDDAKVQADKALAA